MTRQRILVLGVTGMLGHTLLRQLTEAPELDVRGCARSADIVRAGLPEPLARHVVTGVDVTDDDALRRVLDLLRPDVVVNCVGVIKQRPEVADAVTTIAVNALLPHRLARECAARGARLVQISTDCVFSGNRGGYTEQDDPDAYDLYGRSKLLGETTSGTALTLRTSIVGHELNSARSLVDWFLGQPGPVNGFTRAVYSGLTTTEFATMLRTVVLPRADLTGLYHVAATPIAKYHLLRVVADEYGWPGRIQPWDDFRCDRSLSAAAFRAVTGYEPPAWPEMVRELRRAALGWGLPAVAGPSPAMTG
ncbi:SDR family oxidoreductase [Micromonospora sp. WMMD882]|uniref:dTDP-4-dehydrorhamnose reductase family protein n=1 Tax=Micromonospora sp. WMMD882 TaxID=3015151 RepID=UPI00248AC1D2|nr:SDR family oxidoreductase [Micromonospora sp. WMMD882]WBB81584.1 SDR family oxidoreductase [Micromonospora sp. WMMD882]